MKIFFTSELDASHTDELQSLLFFNMEQNKVYDGIIESIEKYGAPEISVINDLIKVNVGGLPGVQSLFAIDQENDNRLAGVMIFFRESVADFVLLHIAASSEYSFMSSGGTSLVIPQLIFHLKSIAKQIKNIENIIIYYHKDCIKKIKIR